MAQLQPQSFHYDFNGKKPDTLTLHGDAHFQPKLTPNLCLTKTDNKGFPVRNSSGQAVYATAINFWNDQEQAEFETTVNFRITTFDHNPGIRLVFFMGPVGTIYPNTSSGSIFSVEFVTSAKGNAVSDFPEIVINIPYPNPVDTKDVGGALLNQDVTAIIQYKPALKKITVTTNVSPDELSYGYDLSAVLNREVEVGLAALTGDRIENHNVISWDFKANLVPRAIEE